MPPPLFTAPNFNVAGLGVSEGIGLACVTVNVCPATVRLPVRTRPVLAATEYVTVPLPAPLAPPVTVIQLALLAAVHVQALDVVTVALPLPPDSEKVWLTGDTEYTQLGGIPHAAGAVALFAGCGAPAEKSAEFTFVS